MNKENFEFNEQDLLEETPKKSYGDLDLGLDFDLSFLDDVDESVLDDVPAEEPAPVKKAPEKKAPAKNTAPGKKPEASQGEAPKKVKKVTKPVEAAGETPAAPVKKTRKPMPKPEEGEAPAPVKKTKKQAPAAEAPVKAEKPKKQKKGPRIGGVIFYTLYFTCILAFFVATYIGLQGLHGWLSDYEAAQPTLKAQQVFDEVFTQPDWGALYTAAGAQDSPYEGKEAYVNYMEQKVGSTALTYMETSAGLSGNKKYIVRLGDEKVASFTLVDKNNVSSPSLGNLESLEDLESITDIPDWQLGQVEVFFQREESFLIQKMDSHTAYVNGVALDESFTIQQATTAAERYLPTGTTGFTQDTQQVTGLMEVPTVTVTDKDGSNVEVTYDEATRTFTARTESNTMSEDEKTVALEAAKIYCLWMIEEEKDRGAIAKYFDPTSEAYNTIVKTTELWMQNHNGYEFANESVTDYARYSDDIFSVRVSLNLNVTRTNGSVKEHTYDQSMFFQKGDSGKWRCFVSTNVNVSEPVGKVRLTFMQGDTLVDSRFYETDAKEVITPKLSVPEGQVFSGWITISQDESGATVYNVEFEPDATGTVAIPEGNTLRPMVLYALFQTAEEAAETATEGA